MKFFADLHIHSHFSRATSKTLDPEHIFLWAAKKGIRVVGTGDLTHPGWVSELHDKLVEAEGGLYRLKPELEKTIKKDIPASCDNSVKFLFTGEISCIYKKNGATRKLHHLILMPDFDSVHRLIKKLDRIGNITSDGRPILGLDSRDLLEIVLEASDQAFFIPAHIWTPWFSVFGSKSGFDSLEECFEDLTDHIHALETGLSSDPPMNRKLSSLDNYILVSNSDAHSPNKMGREANILDTEDDYAGIVTAMTSGEGFLGTVEFFPEEGKYHLDGHRKCKIRFDPAETRTHEGICPVCGKPLTAGVLHRVNELADRDTPVLSKNFYNLIPLSEILSEILDCGPTTKKVSFMYEELLNFLGPELEILLNAPINEIELKGGRLLSEAIDRMRNNRVIKQEGYDAEYGIIHLFEEAEKHELAGQLTLLKKSLKKEKRKNKKSTGTQKTSGKKGPFKQRKQISFLDPVLDPLNLKQREAVLHKEGGHLMVVAGPGTGKTLTLTHRIIHLIQSGQADPGQILALTFTNKAATEMRGRILSLLSASSKEKNVMVTTFHGFCMNVLRKDGETLGLPQSFTVCSELDSPVLAKQAALESGVDKRTVSRFIKALPKLKNSSLLENQDHIAQPELQALYEGYRKKLRSLQMVDLDDLETETLRLLREHPVICEKYALRFPWVFVDEYQDTNPAQAAILKHLIRSGSGKIFAIGDPDQAIYSFRGAGINNFLRFTDDFPGAGQVILTINYRSSTTILKGSAALMEKKSPLEGVMDMGDMIRLTSCSTQAEEAEMVVEQVEKIIGGTSYFSIDSGRVSSHEVGNNIGFGDIAALFRLNSQGSELEKAFKRAGIPYIRSGDKPLISQYPTDIILRFLQVVLNPDSDFYIKAYLDIMSNEAVKGEEILRKSDYKGSLIDLIEQAIHLHDFDLSLEVSADTLRRLKKIAGNFRGDTASFLDMLSLDRGIDHIGLMGDRVALMSLHAAKGLEWPVVFITGCEDGLIPFSLFKNRNDEEERRLFYVGMTRAGRKLILSSAKSRKINGRRRELEPSPFLGLLPAGICASLDRSRWKRKKIQKQLKLF